MKMTAVVGAFLVVVGIIALIYGGIEYTTKEEVLDIGPVEASVEKEHRMPLSPIVGLASLTIGGIMIFAGAKK